MLSNAALKLSAAPDPTFYPVVDKMGEGSLQRLIAELLRPLLAHALAERGFKAFTGADQFIYYLQHTPTESCAPDVYVMSGLEPDLDVDCWKTWEEPRAVPSFAFEIVSRNNPRKDTTHSPVRHAALGTRELIIFDPRRPRLTMARKPSPKTERTRWMIFRRLPRQGFVQVEAHNADRVYSRSLKLWLRVVGEGPLMRVRVARGPKGDALMPTPQEALQTAEAARRASDAAREAADAAREAADAAREAAEAEVLRLRAELDRLRR